MQSSQWFGELKYKIEGSKSEGWNNVERYIFVFFSFCWIKKNGACLFLIISF
jgi:hypothetical protein